MLPRADPLTIDVGAGTGAASEPLVHSGGRVLSVEPASEMLGFARSRLSRLIGWLGGVSASAEALPVRSGSIDLVVAAQAFHWFQARAALDEIARVLRSGGLLAVTWNVAVTNPFLDDVTELLGLYNPGFGRPVTPEMLETPAELAEHQEYEAEPPARFPHSRSMDGDRYVEYAMSWSYGGGAIASEDLPRFEDDLRRLIERHHGGSPWREHLVAVAHVARRI
jgi:ubiquinone/menaquinone biosynthesis C-methylase UbiE